MQETEQKKSPIKQRILQYIAHLQISKRVFYTSIGISRGTLESKSGITEDIIRRFLEKFPDVSPLWLLTGEGEMLKSRLYPYDEEEPKANQALEGAPYYDVDFIGGFKEVENDQQLIPAYYIDFKPYNGNGILWCNICGRSMEPELSSGDIMAIKEVTSPIEYIPYGDIYAIVTDDYRTVKRITRSEREGHIRLVPSNPAPEYVAQDLPVSLIRKIYKVLGSMKRF